MGTPASPTLANVVVNYVLNQFIQILDFVILYLKVYVDDFNLAIPRDKVSTILDKFNVFHSKIQFALES